MKRKKINTKDISVAGLGRLGAPLAAAFASRGFKVIGIDINDRVVSNINRGLAPVEEPRLQELISRHWANLKATLSHGEAIAKTDVTIVIVATPSDKKGNFSNVYVESALRKLAEALKKSPKPYHLFVISSTVMPESTQKRFIPVLEKHSGRRLNEGFGVCYVPDFVALGSVVRDFLNPDFVLIGESGKFAGDQMEGIYKRLCENDPPISRMSIISAEIAKVALNTYITTKISFANMLTNVCERIRGADIDAVTKAIGQDKRIAPYYLRGGLSFGGACFPRDTRAFLVFARKHGYRAELIKAVEKINDFQDKHLAETVLRHLPSDRRVSILGLAFKPDTPVIIGSPAIKLIRALLPKKVKITAYDSLAKENTKAVFGRRVHYAGSMRECVLSSRLCVVTTPDKEFSKLDKGFFRGRPVTLIDCWRVLDPVKLGKRVHYIPLGKSL